MGYQTMASREPLGVEEAGCKIYSRAQTVIQTTGQVKAKKIMIVRSASRAAGDM